MGRSVANSRIDFPSILSAISSTEVQQKSVAQVVIVVGQTCGLGLTQNFLGPLINAKCFDDGTIQIRSTKSFEKGNNI